MSWDLNQFHFIRPLWLFMIPVFIGLWVLYSKTLKHTSWEAHINPKILEAIRVGNSIRSRTGRDLLLFAWVIASVAAAGPTWQKQPVPSYPNESALVIVLDLSQSMLAQDLKPNRLTQAQYKLIDILRARSDGQTALIAYSGDAHIVSPLTDDPNAIEVLLPALHPNIMPTKGSNTEAAIRLAATLLAGTASGTGEILLITDGVTKAAQKAVLKYLNNRQQLSVLAVGGDEPAPIPLASGGFLQSSAGEIILSAPNTDQLRQLAVQTGGRFSPMRIDDADVKYLVSNQLQINQASTLNQVGKPANAKTQNTAYDSWTDMGPWLVLLLIPMVALCFRKGVLFLLPLAISISLPLSLLFPQDSYAFGWQDLWATPDQQAQQLLNQDPQAAAQKFKRDDWAGVANYQAKNYAQAVPHFDSGEDTSSHYNRGNALAMTGDLESAIDAYDRAIKLDPNNEDARHNKALLEQILQQQQEQKGDQQGEDQADQNSDSNESDESQNQDSEAGQQQDESSQQSSQDQPSQDSENTAQEPSPSEEPSAGEEPSADEEPAADKEPAANEEASAKEEQIGANNQPIAQDQSDDEKEDSESPAQATPEQLKPSSEQWLRRIQDDPSGLLRRKFEYQAWQRKQQQGRTDSKSRPNNEERY